MREGFAVSWITFICLSTKKLMKQRKLLLALLANSAGCNLHVADGNVAKQKWAATNSVKKQFKIGVSKIVWDRNDETYRPVLVE